MIWPFNSVEDKTIQFMNKISQELLERGKSVTQLTIEVRKMTQALDALNTNIATLITNVTANGEAVAKVAQTIKDLTDKQAVLSQQLAEALLADDHVAVQAAADSIAAQAGEIANQTATLTGSVPVATT